MWRIGPLELSGRVILAPMAGISDSPFRRLCRRFGSPLTYSEFVSMEGLIRRNQPTLSLLRYTDNERPFIIQIFGREPKSAAEAARIVADLGADMVDLNIGCSVRKVAMKGSGAGLLDDPPRIAALIESMASAVSIPVSAKIRLGRDDSNRNYREVVRILEDSGAMMVAVHGRTRAQGYSGRADWEAIAEIKSLARIPVLGNGDITTPAEAEEKIALYGVDAVLVGRAAIGNPWIFAGRNREEVARKELVETMRLHLDEMCDFCRSEAIALKLFRKHAVKYLRSLPNSSSMRERLMECSRRDEFEPILAELLA